MVDAEASAALGLPDGIRTTGPPGDDVTRLVLVRHGEADCNISGVCGGQVGCTGLTQTGRSQVAVLAERLRRTGELAAVDALYASTLPRARETAAFLAPALDAGQSEAAGRPARLWPVELHPGEADGLTWSEYAARFTVPDWDGDPGPPRSGRGELVGFVDRASSALVALVEAHPGPPWWRPPTPGWSRRRSCGSSRWIPPWSVLRLRTIHASLTVWEHAAGRWLLQRYNDATPVPD